MTILVITPSPAHAACVNPAGNEGDILYNSTETIMQFCDGTNWQGWRRSGETAPANTDPCDPAATPAIGTACLDGTVYAGLSPDGSVPMYAARCDGGMAWDGTACAGNRGRWTWNDGSTSWTESNTPAESDVDGDGNTAILEDWVMHNDQDKRLMAGRYCGKLNNHGHNDWYLPARDELGILHTNRVAIGNFSTSNFSTNRYWSSTDNTNALNAKGYGFHTTGGGVFETLQKSLSYHVRCVRKGYVRPCVSPFGLPGDLNYNTDENVLQWCGGGLWHKAGPIGPEIPAPAAAPVGTCNTAPYCGGSPDHKIVFSRGFSLATGAGGISGQDGYCQDAASAAGLAGTYYAWLADSDPLSAPYYRYWRSPVPYYNPAGTKIADDWNDLVDGTNLDGAIAVDPTGAATFLNVTRTNVKPDGTQNNSASSYHCSDWTHPGPGVGFYGGRDDSNSTWTTGNNSAQCNSGSQFYCFEQDVRCGGPVGNVGDVIYNQTFKTVQYCNGKNWVGVGKNDVTPYAITRDKMGTNIGGSFQFFDSVTAPNGKIYGIPLSNTGILIIDPVTRTASVNGMGLGLGGGYKYEGGALGADGHIYAIPYEATSIIKIDPTTDTATSSAMGADLTGTYKWCRAVAAPNGKIYGIPYNANDILIIDTLAGTATRSNMGAAMAGAGKWCGGVLGNDGKIYALPWSAGSILIIDPVAGTATTSTMGASLTGGSKWNSAQLGSDGKIYAVPSDSNDILIIDPQAGTATRSAMGATLSGSSKYWGSTVGMDGRIYGIPYNAANVLVIDPVAGTASTFTSSSVDLSGAEKWGGAATAADGYIYAVPMGGFNMLVLRPQGKL
jgi:hypothetical protein